MSIKKKLENLVKEMMDLDIHHPQRVIQINRKINSLSHKILKENPSSIHYENLIVLTDEIALLAESLIQASPIAVVRVSPQFTNKQKELKEWHQRLLAEKEKD